MRWIDLGPERMDLIFDVAWSPDSKTVLVDKSDLYIKSRRILLVDAANGEATHLFKEADPKNVTAEWWADWSPDRKGVYFLSDLEDDYHLYYQARAGGKAKRSLQARGRSFQQPCPRARGLFTLLPTRAK